MPINSCRKRPLKQTEVLAIQRYLVSKERWRDLALLAIGIDSFLRSCDLLQLRVQDILEGDGKVCERFLRRQRKTKRIVECCLTSPTRQIVSHWINVSKKGPSDYLFTALRDHGNKPICEVSFRLLVKQWVSAIGLKPDDYSSKSLRKARVRPVLEAAGKDYQIPQILLGHADLRSTVFYADVAQEDAIEIAAKIQFFEPLQVEAQKTSLRPPPIKGNYDD